MMKNLNKDRRFENLETASLLTPDCAENAPTFRHGEFGVYVSVGKADGTPVYELPLPDGDGRRRYRLGTIRFETGAAQ